MFRPLFSSLCFLSFLQLIYIHVISTVEARAFSQLVDISGHFQSLSFEDAYSVIWGDPSITQDGRTVQLKLDKRSGCGFVSLENYMYGFYSASIKFPSDYTAGVVLAFYTSNGGEFPNNHDELDFEFLGNVKGKPWRMQTNIYGNGSVARGREERFNFWFDPTADYHNYSILWNHKHIVFLVDNIPIREMVKSEALGGDYPSKPMAMYATMWDGSQWATDGGKYPVDYKYAPFVASFKSLKLQGCAANPLDNLEKESTANPIYCTEAENLNPLEAEDLLYLSSSQQTAMEWVRKNHLYYSYCDDKARYQVPLPECTSKASSRDLRKRKQRNKKATSSYASHSTMRGRDFR